MVNKAPVPQFGPEPPPPRAVFSFYRGGIKNTVPTGADTPAALHAEIVSTRHKAATKALCAAPTKEERTKLKERFDSVTPAGIFTSRKNGGLIKPSGLLVLDFDDLPDVGAARAALLADKLLAPDLVLIFTSPSGNGLKVLVQTDDTASHLDNFNAYADYLGNNDLRPDYADLGLRPDPSGKDVARACFVPHDPAAWLAPTYA